PDMDVIGASIGILKMAKWNEKQGYIVLDKDDLNKGVRELLYELSAQSDIYDYIITREEALQLIEDNSLLVVVDTHRSAMVIEEGLLERTEKVVIIDHHRRGEDFIDNPLLVYMEPYASSTCELVTELLEYQQGKCQLSMLEATALLAGIVVDTK